MRSPRSWARPLGWLAATLTSIVLASVAMLPVLRTATGGDSGLISADQLRRSGARTPLPVPSAPAPPSRSAPPASGGRVSTSPSASPEPSTPSPSRTSPSPGRTTPTPPARTTTRPAPESRVVDGWTVTTDGNGADTYVRSFRVEGGQAVLRIRNGQIGVVSATPAAGFEVATVQNAPENLAVYFNEQNHSFIVHAGWNVDRPFQEVSEIGN